MQKECFGCDIYGTMNNLGLCEERTSKLKCDLIRQRDSDCSVTAYGLRSKAREELRVKAIKQYGEALELTQNEPEETFFKKRKEEKAKK